MIICQQSEGKHFYNDTFISVKTMDFTNQLVRKDDKIRLFS